MSINNPSLFIGEVVLNATKGAPLSVNSTGNLSSGLTASEVVFSTNLTTTSTTDVLMTGITTTPVAGTYIVWFSNWLTHSNGNAIITQTMYVGGVAKADSIRASIPFVGALSAVTQDITAAMQGVITVNGSQAVEIRWKTSTGTGTAHNGNLTLLRIV